MLTRRGLIAGAGASLALPARAQLPLTGAGKGVAGGGGGYHADAVHFDGSTYLSTNSLTFADDGFFSVIWWAKYNPAIYTTNTLFVSDPAGDYATFGAVGPSIEVASAGAVNDIIVDALPLINTDAWHNIILCVQTSLASPNNVVKLYVDDVDATDITEDAAGSGFSTALNGLPFFFGQDSSNPAAIVDFADVRIMHTSLITGSDIAEATRRLFISASGKPVDPAIATAALGDPEILFSGNASTFGTNQGTGGVFSTTGTLTNASTSPSD